MEFTITSCVREHHIPMGFGQQRWGKSCFGLSVWIYNPNGSVYAVAVKTDIDIIANHLNTQEYFGSLFSV